MIGVADMKALSSILCVVVLLACPPVASSQQAGQVEWAPARYHGLVVGKSTQEDVLKVLGKPTSSGKVADTNTRYTAYEVSDPVPGKLMVIMSHGILGEIDLYPKSRLTTAEAARKFGPDYQLVRYSIDDCLGGGGTSPLYEDSQGLVEHIEYRQLGMALNVHRGEVDTIMFVAKPFGPKHSRCTGKSSGAEKK